LFNKQLDRIPELESPLSVSSAASVPIGCMTFRPSNSGPSHSGPIFRGPELFAVQAHFSRNSGPNY
jgi:hypothetical protein